MSPAYHLLGKAMQGEKLNENQIKNIIGVVRKDERQRIVKMLETEMAGRDSWLTAIELIKGGHK